MKASRRTLLLAGAMGMLQMLARERSAFAQRRLPLLMQATLDLEHSINWRYVGPSWGRRRFAWVAAVQASHTPAQLAARLPEMESVIGHRGVTPAWATERDAWVAAVSAAHTDAQVARLLVTLEGALIWGATNTGWHVTRARWLAALEAIH